MKLWVDDERKAPAGWLHVSTAVEAVLVLKTGKVEEVSLDHDLGEPEEVVGNGYQVLTWIEKVAHTDSSFLVPVIYIHTANPAARVRMRAAVESIEKFLESR